METLYYTLIFIILLAFGIAGYKCFKYITTIEANEPKEFNLDDENI